MKEAPQPCSPKEPLRTIRKAKSALSAVLYGLGAALIYRDVVNRRHVRPLRILSAHRVIRETGPLTDRDRADLARGCLCLSDFVDRVHYLRDNYSFLSLGECLRGLKEPAALPANALVLTFDDGFEDVHRHAWPVLLVAEIPFTVFLTTGFVGRDPLMLNAAQVGEMAAQSQGLVTWGAHGVTHRPLTDLDPAAAEQEILQSRRDVEALTGSRVEVFCYPDGRYNDTIKSLLVKHGFAGACATGRALNYGTIDPFALQRIPFESEPLDRFAFRVAGRT
jgi:peptidoglycan/xylan/chitin deacetylase (PgdA/CDA1 family)